METGPACARWPACWAGTRPPSAGNQTEHVVPVQRERVVPAVPSRPAEDRAVDRTLLRRRARPAQGRPASGRGAQAVQAVGRQVVVVGGGAAAPGPVPAADIRKAARGFSRRRAHARVPGDDLPSETTVIGPGATGGRAACRAGTGAGAGVAAGGRPVSRYPDALRSTNGPSIPGIAAASVIGRPTASSGRAAVAHRGRAQDPVPHGPHHSRQDGRGKPRRPAVAVLRAAAGRQARRHLRQRHGVRQACRASRRAGDGHLLRRSVQLLAARQQREQERHDPAIPAQTGRHQPRHDRGTCRRSSTRPTTVPCGNSATARRPRPSPTNCQTCKPNKDVALTNRQRERSDGRARVL